MPRTKNSAQSAPAKKKNVPEKSVEASLWESANKLRGSVEPLVYELFKALFEDIYLKQRENQILT